jgi:hypothetical protein
MRIQYINTEIIQHSVSLKSRKGVVGLNVTRIPMEWVPDESLYLRHLLAQSSITSPPRHCVRLGCEMRIQYINTEIIQHSVSLK